jgi:hypothetical protein
MILYMYLFNYDTCYISYHTITSYALPHDPSRSLTTIIVVSQNLTNDNNLHCLFSINWRLYFALESPTQEDSVTTF